MYYLQSRYYDPMRARFINADDAVLFALVSQCTLLNAFAYCANSSVNSVDIYGKLAAKLVARIIIGALIGFVVQLLSDLIAIWFANLFGQKAPVVGENGGDYIGSMISWALTCVSFKSKVANVVSSLLPVVIKQVSRWFNGSIDWVDFLIDIAVTILSFIINKCIDRTAKNKLEKIIKKAGKGNGSHRIIKVKQKRLDLKIKVLGMKFNLGINISSFFVSSVYSLLSNLL